MFWHDDFFTLRDGEKRPFFHVGKFQNRMVIQHPYFWFGSLCNAYLWKGKSLADSDENTPIYLQQFEVAVEGNVFDFHDFLARTERNRRLKPDECLWYETGFWTITIERESFMGIGLENLRKMLVEKPDSKFALCVSNTDSVIIMSSGGSGNETILISIYASNELFPFAEVIEPIQKSIEVYDRFRLLKSEMGREENIRRFWFARRTISLDPVAFIMDIEWRDYKRLPVLKNQFKRTRDSVVGEIEYLMGTMRHGFTDSDYNEKRDFDLYAEIWELESSSIVEFHFELADVR